MLFGGCRVVDDFFAGLIGHEELKKRFSRLIETGRMPQASLFPVRRALVKPLPPELLLQLLSVIRF